MKPSNEKTTLYLDPRVKRGVQFYALRDRRSLSDIVNEKLLNYLEDMADLEVVQASKDEPSESFESVVKALGFTLDEIRDQAKKRSRKSPQKT